MKSAQTGNFIVYSDGTPTRNMVDIMHNPQRSLRIGAVFVFIMALCSASPATLADRREQLAPWVGTTFSGIKCDGLRTGSGPWDYLQRAHFPAELEITEDNHFLPDVENLIKGSTGTVIGDLHYTLKTWPNHHRALNSVLKYRLQHMGAWMDPNIPPAECYMQRAIHFSPNDPKPYMMFGLLLHKAGKYEEALSAYRTATRLQPDDIMTQYNMGLVLVELKKYDEAQQVAKRVYAAGFPLPGLKNKLAAANHWTNASNAANAEVSAQAKAATVEVPATSTTPSNEASAITK